MLRAVISFFLLPLTLSVLLFSCSKGDQGPVGSTGATGAAGAAGATGAQGPAGSANVIYSQWFTPPAYTKDTIFGIYGLYYRKATTDITQAILDSGIILTYGKLDGYTTVIWPTNQVEQLPITVTYQEGSTTYIDTWQALDSLGNLKILFQDDLNLYNGISNAHQFRYIIIPGGQKSAVASVSTPIYYGNGRRLDANAVNGVIRNYKTMSYAQVCARLGIEE
jgi:hypothetical protein